MSHIDQIIADAHSYKGQEEIQPNVSFKDPGFLKKMLAVGFYKGASWCAFFVMLVLFQVYADVPLTLALLKKYCSASTQTMWANFKASKEFVTGMIPKVGAIAIYKDRKGKGGHTGLVIAVNPDLIHYELSEGNSNTGGSANGFEVAENLHSTETPLNSELELLGFVYMPE